jgi:LacI family transcriptional regulator
MYEPNYPKKRSETRSNAIGLISTVFAGPQLVHVPYTNHILQGVLHAADECDYNVTLFTRPWQRREESQRIIVGAAVDGVLIVAPSIHSDLVVFLAELEIPLVAISADAVDLRIPTVDMDDQLGATLATEHLISLGHTRIAHLAGTMSQVDAFTRRDAFFSVMAKHGLTVPGNYVVETGFNAVNAYADATRLLSLPERPTAIFGATDYIAYWTVQAARDLGIEVPRDLSVIGYDDAPIAVDSHPRITTIRQPLVEMGDTAPTCSSR